VALIRGSSISNVSVPKLLFGSAQTLRRDPGWAAKQTEFRQLSLILW